MSYHHHHSSQGPPPPPPPPSAPTHSSNPAYYHPSSLPSSQQQQQQQGRGTPNSNSSNGAGPYGQMPPSSNSPYGQLTHDGQHQQQQPPSHHQQQSNSPYQPPMTGGYASHPGYSSMPGTSGHHQGQPGHPQGGYPSAGYPEHAPHLPPPPPHYATHGGYPGTGYGHVPGASEDMYHQHHQLQQQGHHVPPPPPHHHQPYHAGSNEPPSMAANAGAGSSSSPGGVGGPSNGSGSNNNGHSSSRNDDPRGQHPDLPAGMRPKRRQVKNACVNCQKACKKCDEGRPCGRCVKYGLSDTCFDSTRKERKRGIKRGPYKRRNTGTNAGASGSGSAAGNGSNGAPAGSSTTTTSAPSGNNASASLDAQHHAHHVGQQPSPSYIKSESGPYEGSHYDANGPTPYSNPSSYRSLAPFASNNSSNNANNGNHNGGGYSSSSSSGGPPAPPQQSNMSPSLFQRDQPRSQAVNAIVNHHASVANNQLGNNNGNGNDGVTQSGGSRGAWTGPHILTNNNNNEALSRLPWGHSTALPLGQQQQQQQNNTQYTQQSPIYNVSALPGAGSSSSSGGYALPSPSLLNNGPRSATLPSSTSSLFSPPTLPSTGSSGYLSAFASGPGGHQRFTSDSNLQQHHGGHHQHSASTPSIASAGGSSGSSAAFSSPRTPLSADPLHSLGGSQHSLPASSNVGSMDPPMSTSNNSYIKSPASYVHHPQPLMGGGGASRPFPLHLPQFPKYSNSQGGNNGGAYGTAK